jgi:DNA-binding transcriptional ArsR family regulator
MSIEGISKAEAERVLRLFKRGGGQLDKFKFPKRELKTMLILKKIVEAFPCTFSVLKRKTGLSKPTISRYLKRLLDLNVVRKEFDPKTELNVYYLNRFSRFDSVVDLWYSAQPQYSICRVFRKGSRVKLAVAGKKSPKG